MYSVAQTTTKRRTRKGAFNLNGKNIHKGQDYCLKKLSFQDVKNHMDNGDWVSAECQRDIDFGKVEDIRDHYLKFEDPNYLLNNTNPIQLGEFDDKIYIIDGQHRINMISNIVNTHSLREHNVAVHLRIHKNKDEIYERFVQANINNSELPIPKEELANGDNARFYTKLKALLKKYYGKQFANTNKNGALLTLDNFMNILHTNNFRSFARVADEYKALDYLREKSDNFSTLVDYKHYSSPQFNYLYKAEHQCLSNGFTLSLKRNNARKWLFDSNIKARHNWRQAKKTISKSIKRRVWNEYTDLQEDLCPLSCPNHISKNSFQAGHIIPEARGGLVTIENLIPICKECNTEMATKTLEEYCLENSLVYNDIMKQCKRNKP